MKRMFAAVAMIAIIATTGVTAQTRTQLSGFVRDAQTGQVLNQAIVTLSPGGISTFSNTDGGFVISFLEPKTYTLRITKAGYQTYEQTINMSTNQVLNVSLTPTTQQPAPGRSLVYGNIRDTQGRIVNQATVTLTPGGTSTFSNTDGNYAISNVQNGQYTMRVTKPGFMTYEAPITVEGGEVRRDIVLQAQ